MIHISDSRCLIQCGWDDVPHLSAGMKAKLLSSTLPYQRDARSKGTPSLGAGAIFPVPESEIICAPFQIPAYWPRVYGKDVGWKITAVVWGARDPTQDIVYLFGEHYRGEVPPSTHAAAVKARGEWIPGVIDPASRGRNQTDGERLLQTYRDLGLNLTPAENAVDAGLYQVWERLETGRLKVFSTLQKWRWEFRLYRRDEKGRIVKKNDHLMDATRYLIVSGLSRACVKPMAAGISQSHPQFGGANVAGY